MTSSLPKTQEIITYARIYGEPPSPPIEIIRGMCKKSLIYEIVHINHWLNPKNKVYFDNSFNTQLEILAYLTRKEETNVLFDHYLSPLHDVIKNQGKLNFTIFNRINCLFALELITNSEDIKNIPGFELNTLEKWKNLIDFLLAINWDLIDQENKGLEKIQQSSIESLNPVMLPINELMIESHFIFTPYRAQLMIEYFLNSKSYGRELIAYFKNTYQLHPKEFCKRMITMYLGKSTDNPNYEFYYKIGANNIFIKKLSERFKNQEHYKLLGLRKSPFIQVSDEEFLLGDKTFLIEKIYTQFINDFWFDWLKPQKNAKNLAKFKMSDYRGEFGRFFENYGAELLKNTFAEYKYSTCLASEELKYGKIEKELCDFYLRYEKRILLIEIKGGGIDDKSKYGGDIESLYKNDRAKFYERYGVDQLITAISKMEENLPKMDPNFPTGKTITVYPIIIVNEKVFQTPLMAQLFNARFQEQVHNIKLTKVNVKPLAFTHISDWENAEDYLYANPKKIWALLDYHCRNRRFIPPFFNTLNRKLPKLNKGRKVVDRFLNVLKEKSSNVNPI